MFNIKPSWDAGGWRLRSALGQASVDAEDGNDPADILVIVRPSCKIASLSGPVWSHSPDGTVGLTLPGLGSATMREGHTVVLTPEPGADSVTWELLIEGPVMAVLQLKRGLLPLDGSALGWRDGTVLIVGPSGQGKTSLAAALALGGWPVLSDGVLAVDARTIRLTRGAARLRLWQRPAHALGIDFGAVRLLRPGVARGDLDWPGYVRSAPWPIRGIIFAAGRTSHPTCTPVSAAAAVPWIMASVSASAAFKGDATLLESAMDLATRIPCWRLEPAQGVERLAETAGMIQAALS